MLLKQMALKKNITTTPSSDVETFTIIAYHILSNPYPNFPNWLFYSNNRSLLSTALSPNYFGTLAKLKSISAINHFMLFLSDFTTRVIDDLCFECIHSLCRKVWISLQLKPIQTSQVETESRYGLRKTGYLHASRVTDYYLQLGPELMANIPGSKCKNNKCCVQPLKKKKRVLHSLTHPILWN